MSTHMSDIFRETLVDNLHYKIDNTNLWKKKNLPFSIEQTTIRYNFTARFAIPIPKQTSHRAQTIRRLFSLIEYTHDHFHGSW